MSAPLDLGALLARAQAGDDLIGIWVNKREIRALVEIAQAAHAYVDWTEADTEHLSDVRRSLDQALEAVGGDQ